MSVTDQPTRAQRTFRWIVLRLPERPQAYVMTFGEALRTINDEVKHIQADRDGDVYAVAVWIRGMARGDFERLRAILPPDDGAPALLATGENAWDDPTVAEIMADLPMTGARHSAVFLFSMRAADQARAARRTLGWLAERFEEARIGPVDGVRVEVENPTTLIRHLWGEDA